MGSILIYHMAVCTISFRDAPDGFKKYRESRGAELEVVGLGKKVGNSLQRFPLS